METTFIRMNLFRMIPYDDGNPHRFDDKDDHDHDWITFTTG